jgi:hypothetical protein
MQWKRFGIIPGTLSVLLLWAGCTSKPTEPNSPPPAGSTSAYPISIGSWWKYEVVQRSTWSWAPEDTVLRVDTVIATVIDTIRLDSTDVLAGVVLYEPYFPDLSGSSWDTLFVAAPARASMSVSDTVFLYRSRDGSRLWRAFALGGTADDSTSSCLVSAQYSTTFPVYIQYAGDSSVPQQFYAHCPSLESAGEFRYDWLQPGVGLVHAYYRYEGSPGDASRYIIEHTWSLLNYHIEQQPTSRGHAQRRETP